MGFVHRIDGIRFGEFDLGGVLYHANYFHLYEQVREAFLAHANYPYSRVMADKAHLAIAEAHQEFLRPIRYGDVVTAALSVAEARRSSFRFVYAFQVDGTDVHRGWTRMVFVREESSGFRPAALPTELATALSAIA